MSIRNLVPWRGDKSVPVRRAEEALPAFHRLFDDFFDSFFRGLELAPFGRVGEFWDTSSPVLDLKETDEEYQVSAELPGWDEKEIEVSLSGDVLTIRGEHEEEKDEGEKGSDGYRQHRRYGSFRHSVRVPADVDKEGISATCARGVLTVSLPKTEESRKAVRKIEVKTG